MVSTREHGNYFESQALQFLRQRGLTLLQQNFICRLGEIDLVMLEEKTLVFVEVRYRKNILYGSAAETISYHKQQKIKRTAHYFLMLHKAYQQNTCRFDAITIDGGKINWIKNAFSE